MLSWLRRRRETAERIDAEADALIGELGVEAHAEARRREYESSGDAIALWWSRVALAVAHKTGERIGLDTSTDALNNNLALIEVQPAIHLAPYPSEYLAQTLSDLKEIGPDYLVPLHCSGEPFFEMAKGELGPKVIRGYTGTRLDFS
jgi:hypothetical protein